ncbi:VWA domain-containing protein [Desulfosarcina alkanivorans]|nr:VWA domain-containing protein [Desulfosarcina alkanivorans]
MRVSTAEVMDCLEQIRLVDMLDERQFNAVLRANFAKSRREQRRFDHLYHLFFHELQVTETAGDAGSLETPIDGIRNRIRATADDQLELAAISDFLAGEPAAYLQLLQQIQSEGDSRRQGPGSNLGALVRRFPVLRALDRAAELADHYLADHRDEIHWETRRQVQRHLERRLAVARRLLVREEAGDTGVIRREDTAGDRQGELGNLAFNALTPSETTRMRETIAQLVRKLKDTVGLRYAVRSRGVLDVKRTLRQSARYQGVPVQIVFRKKPPRKARIAVLCDISGSVWSSARFMLNMLYSLQECFDRVRSFVFVAEVAEVTRFFDDHEVARAIENILTEAGINYGASTDYGLTLRQFCRRYLDAVNKKTTVIVIGDGRSNYANPEGQLLEDIRDRCRRLVWLNPETEQFWYTGDSEMRTYQGICNEVRPCRNLNQLAAFIKDLVL